MRRIRIHGLLMVALVMVAGACGGPTASSAPGASGAPSPSAAVVIPTALPPSAEPSIEPSIALPTPTTGPSPTASTSLVFPEFSYVSTFVMRVAVSDLNVRRKPTRSGISEGKAPKGGLFMMYDWPIQADGYTWYYGFTLLTSEPGVIPDLPTPIETGYDEVLGGWMATGTEDTPFLIPVAPRCPAVRDLRNVAAMLASERISCFGSATLQLEGTYLGEGCGGEAPGTYEPAWLAHPLECGRLDSDGDEGRPLYLHFAPDGPALPVDGATIRLRGHFSDARSGTCRITVLGDDGTLSVKIDDAAAEQWCRGRFVVESYEVIG